MKRSAAGDVGKRSDGPSRARERSAARSCSTCVAARGRRPRSRSASRSGEMRRSKLAKFDDGYRSLWGDLVAGVDEAGRGPLAGPVVAACVVLPADARGLRGVRDSKEMSAEERGEAEVRIRAVALGVGVGMASVEEVDAFN